MSKNSSENIEKSKSSDYERRNILELDLMKSFVSGGLAGIVAKTAIAPFERVKVIFQTSSEQFSYKKAF
jgi:Mitochondrial carrier protein